MIKTCDPALDVSSPKLKHLGIRPLLLGLGLVFSWVAWTTFWDAGLYGDNVEQLVWVHRLQWGYYKHPPMPTWLLGGAIQLVGPHSWLSNTLAAICFAITGWLTWLIARELFSEKIANAAIVLWTLQQCFSVSAQIYNHNTVLVMFMAAVVYTALRAVASKKGAGWWLACGVLAGCAMLSKYQAALPLFALLVTLCINNRQPLRSLLAGLTVACAGFAVVFSPHLYWAVANNFPTLRYASAAVETGGMANRLAWVATFFVNQLRMVLPLLLTVGLSVLICKIRPPSAAAKVSGCADSRPGMQASVWMWGLVGAPVLVLVAISLVSGSQLRNHWGVQLFQFLPLWLAWHFRRSAAFNLTRLMPVALAIHAVGFAYYASKQSDSNTVQAERRADSAYPARDMASAALAHWRLQTACPLTIIGGDFEAGLASAFIQDFPKVYSGPVATPWVKPEQIQQSGILYIAEMNTALPPDAIAVKKWFLNPAKSDTGKYVQFALKLPANACN